MKTETVTVSNMVQTFSNQQLADVTNGRVDIAEVVRAELAARGLDLNGQWIGFKRGNK